MSEETAGEFLQRLGMDPDWRPKPDAFERWLIKEIKMAEKEMKCSCPSCEPAVITIPKHPWPVTNGMALIPEDEAIRFETIEARLSLAESLLKRIVIDKDYTARDEAKEFLKKGERND